MLKVSAYLTLILLIAPLAVVITASKWIDRHYAQHEGTVAVSVFLASVYLFIGQLYYLRNERFYLWVHRQLLRIRRTHTFWKFTIRYDGIDSFFQDGNCIIDSIQNELLAVFKQVYAGKAVTAEPLANALALVVNQADRFTFAFDVESNTVTLSTSKLLVPSHLYSSFLNSLAHLYDRLEKSLRPKTTTYGMSIEFERNPYFGFFVRHVPQRLISEFRCSFDSTIDSGGRIQATKDAIYLDCADNSTLRELASRYLSLSDTLITSGTAE